MRAILLAAYRQDFGTMAIAYGVTAALISVAIRTTLTALGTRIERARRS